MLAQYSDSTKQTSYFSRATNSERRCDRRNTLWSFCHGIDPPTPRTRQVPIHTKALGVIEFFIRMSRWLLWTITMITKSHRSIYATPSLCLLFYRHPADQCCIDVRLASETVGQHQYNVCFSSWIPWMLLSGVLTNAGDHALIAEVCFSYLRWFIWSCQYLHWLSHPREISLLIPLQL